MSEWQPIETATRDTAVIVWQPDSFEIRTDRGDHEAVDDLVMARYPAGAYTAHWDAIDSAWCMDGGTWLGPFLKPTHWMPKPGKPK